MSVATTTTYQDHVQRFGWLPMCHTYGCLNFCREGRLCDNCASRYKWSDIEPEDRPMALLMMRGGASPEMVMRGLKVRTAALAIFDRVQSMFGIPGLATPFADRSSMAMLVDAATITVLPGSTE